MNKIAGVLFLVFLFSLPVFSETGFVESFSEYGIKTVGIYTEAYEDLRSDNFLAEISVMKSHPELSSPYFYRNEYCNFDRVTPPLTTRSYPLDGSASGVIDDSLDEGLTAFLAGLGWQSSVLGSFPGGKLADLLSYASAKALDAVLVVRYTPIRYFIPVEAYREDWLSGNSSIITGDLKLGIAYIPALELYDTRTGTRLWYSAYHTGHQIAGRKQPYMSYVENAGEFFVSIDIDDNEIKAAWAVAELADDFDLFFGMSDADKTAVDRMIELTMVDIEHPFPAASASGLRDDSKTGNRNLRRLLWTDYPSYQIYGTEWGAGYSFDYIGDYSIYYKDDSEAYPGDTPVEHVNTIRHMIMHKISLPFYSLAFRNLSIDPVLSFGYVFPVTYDISYSDIKGDGAGGYYSVPADDTATTSISSLSLELALRYYIRPADKFSLYFGGLGSINSWWEKNECDEAGSDEIMENYQGLYVNYDADLVLNASVVAGARFDMKRPFEVFAMYTPVGPGGKMMFSAGIKWLPFTWGWVEPHQRYVAEDLSIF